MPLTTGVRRALLALVAVSLPFCIWFVSRLVVDAEGTDPPLLQLPDLVENDEWIVGVPATALLAWSVAYLTRRGAWVSTDIVRFGAVIAIGAVVGLTAAIASLRTDGADIGGALLIGVAVLVVPVLGLIAIVGPRPRGRPDGSSTDSQ